MRKFFNLAAVLGTLAASAAFGTAVAQEPKSIKVGYAISLSGPQAAGAMLTTVPNYRLWVDDVNKAGGLMLKKYNKRIPLELVEVDDRSDNQDMVRQVERMMSVDKLDIVLSPWGTGPNLQAAPTFAKFGYPQIMGTAGSDKLEDFVQKFPTMFWFLSKPNEQIKALVDLLADQKGKGKINDTVAVFVVQHPVRRRIQRLPQTCAGERRLQGRLRDQLRARRCRSLRPDQRGQGGQSRQPDRHLLSARHLHDHRAVDRQRLHAEGAVPGRRLGLPQLQGQVRRQGERHPGSRRLRSGRAGHEGVFRAPQGREQGPGARPLGQPQHLRRVAGAAAGDRDASARSTTPRSCRR